MTASFDSDFLALVGPDCIRCGTKQYDSNQSLAEGYLKYSSQDEKQIFLGLSMYLFGKWGTEAVSTQNVNTRNRLYAKEGTAQVFVIKDLKIEVFGLFNMSMTLNEDGFIGLSPKIYQKEKHESFGEYLKRKGIIKSNQLAVDEPNTANPYFSLKFGEFNKSALQVPLVLKSYSQGRNSYMFASSGFDLGKDQNLKFENGFTYMQISPF